MPLIRQEEGWVGWPVGGLPPAGGELLRCEEAFCQGEPAAGGLIAAWQPLLGAYLRGE